MPKKIDLFSQLGLDRDFLDRISDGWFDWDLNTQAEYLSPKFKALFGYTDEELPNEPGAWKKLMYEEDVPRLLENIKKHLDSSAQYPYIQEVRYKHKNGATVWVITRGYAVRDEQGKYSRILGTNTDITPLKTIEERLQYLANHDSLTNLNNRYFFYEVLEKCIASAKRFKRKLAVAYLDIDNFKTINDKHGHVIGDKLLQHIGSALNMAMREMDIAARIGGDEFGVIFTELDDRKSADIAAERLKKQLSKPVDIEQHKITPSLSIGLALYPDDGNNIEDLLRHSDEEMYRLKNK